MVDEPSVGRGAAPHLNAPFIGRSHELGRLRSALSRVLENGRSHVVVAVGAAGVGKGRLLDEFVAEVGALRPEVRVLRGQCAPGGGSHGPLDQMLRERFSLGDFADEEAMGAAFVQEVADVLGDRRVGDFADFLGNLLGLRRRGSPLTDALSGQERPLSFVRRSVLRLFFEQDARRRPLVLVLEDLQWADSDSLETLEHLVGSLDDVPILIVAAGRRELLARIGHQHHPQTSLALENQDGAVELLEVEPLGEDEASMLARALLGPTGEPPDDMVEAAVSLTGGNPYLVEQMVRSFFEHGALSLRSDGSWAVALERLDESQLPLTVEDVVAARMGGLTRRERGLLEMAATVGGVFWLGALVSIERMQQSAPELWGGHQSIEDEFQEILERLEERDYVLTLPDSTLEGEREYAFKHNLEREALQRLVASQTAQSWNLTIAEWLEFRLTGLAEEQCDLLAQHFELGASRAKAARYYVTAGDCARARHGIRKAADYYARGLALLDNGDVTLRLSALHHYGDVLQVAGRSGEALRAFRQMLELAYRMNLKAKGGAAHNRIGRLYRSVGQLDDAMRHLGTAEALFASVRDEAGVASCLDDIGKIYWMRGGCDVAEDFIQRGLRTRRGLGHVRSIALSLHNLGAIYRDTGRYAASIRAFEEALVLRRQVDDVFGIAETLQCLGDLHRHRGSFDEARRCLVEALEVARSCGDQLREAHVLVALSEAQEQLGTQHKVAESLERANQIAQAVGDCMLEGQLLRVVAVLSVRSGDLDAAQTCLARSQMLFDNARARPFLASVLRTQGQVFAQLGTEEGQVKAQRAFLASIDLFERLHNELELGLSCDAYAEFLETCPAPPEGHGEAVNLRERAAKIRQRVTASEP